VEEAISKLNLNPVLARAGRERWFFHQGSAEIRMFVYNNNYLFATSPLNDLPRKNLGIAQLATKADDLDDMFVNDFGAKMTQYSK